MFYTLSIERVAFSGIKYISFTATDNGMTLAITFHTAEYNMF